MCGGAGGRQKGKLCRHFFLDRERKRKRGDGMRVSTHFLCTCFFLPQPCSVRYVKQLYETLVEGGGVAGKQGGVDVGRCACACACVQGGGGGSKGGNFFALIVSFFFCLSLLPPPPPHANATRPCVDEIRLYVHLSITRTRCMRDARTHACTHAHTYGRVQAAPRGKRKKEAPAHHGSM